MRTESDRTISDRLWAVAERLIALGGLIVLMPMFLVLYPIVRLGSSGPFIFKQMRPGLGNRPFGIYKIRTLAVGSEKATALGVDGATTQVTRIGRILRELKIDEMPQLWNILRGDMALVGPRPIPQALHDELCRKIPNFERRGLVRPGLTNVGQVCVLDNALGDGLIDDWSRRFEGELHYIKNRSPSFDIVIIFMTALFFLRKAKRALRGGKKEMPAVPLSPDTIQVADVPVTRLDYDGVVERVGEMIEAEQDGYVCICPVHSIVEARRNESHREALLGATMNTPDGVPVVWAQRLFGHPEASRVYGPTLMLELLTVAEEKGWRVALYGGHEDRLPLLIEKLNERFPELDLALTISPPFRPLTEEEEVDVERRFNEVKPHLTFVGLGCPKQERWMHEHSSRFPGIMFGVGAAFDFHAGIVPQAPGILQRMGLEWAFRLACEPRRLFMRYLTTNPRYIAMIARQWCRRPVRRRTETEAELELSPAVSS